MSQIKLLHSGGNGVSIVAPDSNPASDRTLKLPSDGDGTILTTNSSVGKILQVQQTHYSGRVSASIASGGEWAPSQLNTAITPSATTSKVLITAKVAVGSEIAGRMIFMSCYRGSTQIAQGDASGNNIIRMSSVAYLQHDNTVADIAFQFLDTPSTTSSTTYSFRFLHSQTATMTLYINRPHNATDRVQDAYLSSNVTLQEVGA